MHVLPDPRTAFSYAVPVGDDRSVRVLFGDGTRETVGAEAHALGRRVLVVAGPHEDPYVESVVRQLGDAFVGRLRDVTQHVPVELASDAAATAERAGAESLVAIGGGSATGLAKAIALETDLPILAVPTTYAGSEMTSIWGLTGQDGKTTGRDGRVQPRTVVYDPTLTLSLPPSLTAASGMNALAHALESLYAPDTTAHLSEVAGTAMSALATALPVAVAYPGDLDSRTDALYGAWLAGWCLGSTTMGLHHKLAHVLGGRYRLPHAGVHSALLPQVADLMASRAPVAFHRAAQALGVGAPEHVAPALFDLAHGMSAPTSLDELGLDAGTLDDVVDLVVPRSAPEVGPITRAELLRLLEHAYIGSHP